MRAILRCMQEPSTHAHAQLTLARLLDAHGILPTPQRVELAALLLATRQHVSAEQIIAKARAVGLSVSKATVYNTLGLFAERGLVREVIVDAARAFYDSNIEPHHHFYNVDEGTLTDIPLSEIRLQELPEPPPGTMADGVDIVIRVRNRQK